MVNPVDKPIAAASLTDPLVKYLPPTWPESKVLPSQGEISSARDGKITIVVPELNHYEIVLFEYKRD